MKRPELLAVFAPVDAQTVEITRQLVEFIEGELRGFLGFNFFARIKYNPGDDLYHFQENRPDFEDVEGLLSKIETINNGMWRAIANFGFQAAEIYPAVFPVAQHPAKSVVVITIDHDITRWVETDDSTPVPFTMVLIRLAKLIGSNWFFCGPHMYEWRSFDLSRPISHSDMCNPYVVAWKQGLPEGQQLISDLSLPSDNIFHTIHNYDFANFFPDFS